MRSMIRMFVLAAVSASATAAFAVDFDRVAVNVPFSFETHGKTFPAGAYEVAFDPSHDALRLSSKNDTKMSFMWIATPAEFGPNASRLSLKFDDKGDGTHSLRSIRLAKWATPVLDTREKHAAQPEVSITGGR